MARPKKGTLYNVIFPMVDGTDFASIESGITASDFNSAATRQYIGYNHGASATAAFSNLSKTTNLIQSGIFHHVLNETETNFDVVMVRFTHPSCADQLLVLHFDDYDDSDLMSRLSDIGSDLLSYLTGMSGAISDVDSQLLLNASMISDAHSAATQTNSRILVVQSMVSDVDSQLLLNASMISNVDSALTSQFTYLSNTQSNMLSYLTGISGMVSDVDSQLTVTHSLLSDVDSQVNLLATSNYLSQVHSDLTSQIDGIAPTITASDMSDIASRVWATTEGTRVDSRILVIQSMVSDVDSQLLLNASLISDVDSALTSQFAYLSNTQSNILSYLTGISASVSDVESAVDLLATSNYLSQVHSDLTSQIGGITVTVTASDMSDIASRVWATTEGARVDSRILVIQSMVSDVDSQLLLNASMISDVDSALTLHDANMSAAISDAHSDLGSQIGAITLTVSASDMSDIVSRVWSEKYNVHSAVASTFGSFLTQQIQGASNLLSNISGAVSDVDSQLLLNASMISDIQSAVALVATSDYLSQVHSDLTSQIGGITATVTASDMSDIASRVWATTEGTRVDSRILVIQSLVSDVDSQLLLNASMLSDVDSALTLHDANISAAISDAHSDLGSQIGAITASITASDMSDIASRVWATTEGTRVDSRILVIQSLVSDVDSQVNLLATSNYLSQVHSDLASAIDGVTATVSVSDISDIASAVWANTIGARVDSRILVIQSNVSDVESAVDLLAQSNYLSQVHSDLSSQIGAITASVSTSDISDIASAVWAAKYTAHSGASSFGSLMSDIISVAQQTNSRVLVVQSMVSDVDSALTLHDANISAAVSNVDSQLLLNASVISDVQSAVALLATSNYLSQAHSDLTSQIGGITTAVTASDISDIASAVQAILASDVSDILSAAQQTNSRTLVIQSMVSDVDSALTLHDANISAAVSDIDSQLDVTHSLLSDVDSALTLHDANISAAISDAHSDLGSQIGGVTASIGGSDISDIASAVWADTIGTRVDSRLALVQSNVSDIESQVDLLPTSDYLSQVHSDLTSQIGTITATVSASDISDIASAVWANSARTLTQAAASVTAAVSGDTVTVYRGTTWSISLTGLGDISTYDIIYFSVKADLNDSEDDAYLRVKNDASGLERLNQAAPTAATNGTITIDDATAGDITITVNEAETTGLPIISGLTYDVKGVDNDGQVDLISIGTTEFTISGDVTRAIT